MSLQQKSISAQLSYGGKIWHRLLNKAGELRIFRCRFLDWSDNLVNKNSWMRSLTDLGVYPQSGRQLIALPVHPRNILKSEKQNHYSRILFMLNLKEHLVCIETATLVLTTFRRQAVCPFYIHRIIYSVILIRKQTWLVGNALAAIMKQKFRYTKTQMTMSKQDVLTKNF